MAFSLIPMPEGIITIINPIIHDIQKVNVEKTIVDMLNITELVNIFIRKVSAIPYENHMNKLKR
jgi:hypothetical protein